MKNHIKVKHGENQKRFGCDICGKTFAVEKTIRIHKDMVHLKKWPHQCEFCKNYYSTKGT